VQIRAIAPAEPVSFAAFRAMRIKRMLECDEAARGEGRVAGSLPHSFRDRLV